MWVSASDIGRTPHGQFHWSDGTPVDKANWETGEPDRAEEGKETCGFLRTGDTKLFDIPCSLTTSILLCELPAALFTCFE